jgi:hypothetical protein
MGKAGEKQKRNLSSPTRNSPSGSKKPLGKLVRMNHPRGSIAFLAKWDAANLPKKNEKTTAANQWLAVGTGNPISPRSLAIMDFTNPDSVVPC